MNPGESVWTAYRTATNLPKVLSILLLALMSGCGGGGSGSSTPPANGGGTPGSDTGVSMSISPKTLSVSASPAQPAPTASFQIYISGLQGSEQVYLSGTYSENGISSSNLDTSAEPATVAIQFKTPASLGSGVYNDSFTIKGCYDQACTQQITNSPQTVQVQYTVTGNSPPSANGPAQVISISPSTATAASPAFTLTVYGENFTSQSTVLWNGDGRTTTFVSSAQLTAQITAADIANAGSIPISVTDPTTANGVSNSVAFTIRPAPLTLTSISPQTVAVAGPTFTMTLLGKGFTGTSVAQLNGSARPTTFVSTRELLAQITAADIATASVDSVTVTDPSSSIGTTPAQTLTIAVPLDAVAFQINPAHNGGINFATANLPASAAWSVDVGGTPSYALIAAGKVFVTVTVGNSSTGTTSELIALDQATGATVWGPIAVAGFANATYDSGTVFLISSQISVATVIEAFDAQSGKQLWTTPLTGEDSFTAAPNAANGLVFAAGAGDGGTLYALDESSGTLVWTKSLENGGSSIPAVTADGLYLSYDCETYAFRPATGEATWYNNTGCSGGGAATPVVANQLLYSPISPFGYDGIVFNAETGANLGTYSADTPSAFTATSGYFLQSGTLRGITLSNNTLQWSFTGDGQLNTAPIAVNQYVFIGSASGNLYALDGTSGQQLWQVTLPAAISSSVGTIPFSGLSAGDGLLVVPAGTKVTAYVLSMNP